MKKKKIAIIMACVGLMQSGLALDKIGAALYNYGDGFIFSLGQALQSVASEKEEFQLLLNNSQNYQGIQNDQVDIFIDKGVKALAINLVEPVDYKTILKQARKNNLPIVFFNRDPGKEAIESYEKAFYVGTNPKESGIIQGELIAKHWKSHPKWDLNKDGKIQYVILKGEPGHPDAEARTEYVVKTLKNKGVKLEEIGVDTAMWDAVQAKAQMDAWLSSDKGDKIEVVIANNDGMALGAIESMKSRGKVLPTFGVDAIPKALQLIKSGELQGTVLNDGKGQAQAVYTLVANLSQGKQPLEGADYNMHKRHLLVPYVGIDKSNVAKFEEKSE